MTEYSPAPWLVDSETGASVIGGDDFMVADCGIFSLRKGGPDEKRCRANAALVAAAPDLHEALKKVKIELSALVHPPFPGTPAISDWPCENPGDRECLDAAWHIVADALAKVPA